MRTRARGEEQQGWQPQPNFFNSIWVSLRDILKWKWRRGGSGPIPFQWTLTAPNGTEFKVDCYYTQLKPVLAGAGMKLDGTDKLITRPNSGAAIPCCAVSIICADLWRIAKRYARGRASLKDWADASNDEGDEQEQQTAQS